MMESQEQTQLSFIELKSRFDNQLTNGQRAEIRRVGEFNDLSVIPAVYRLGFHHLDEEHFRQWLRIVYFLPYAAHNPQAESLGKQLAKSKINEMRLFQLLRSEYPQDLTYLRRMLQQMKSSVNWQDFGKMLFYWGERQKRRLLEDYFMAQGKEKQGSQEKIKP